MKRLKELFSEIFDVRDSSGKRHCLMHIMIISVCAMLCGYFDFEDIADYGEGRLEWFDEHLKLWNGIPCAATFRNVFNLIKPEVFLNTFLTWIGEIVASKEFGQIIIDGKAIRAATEKAKKETTPYIVSAYFADTGISIGQLKVDKKSNEIIAIPKLIELLDINGCIITIDAIGTQEKIMDLIIKNGGQFVLPLKENQKGAYQDAENYFNDLSLDSTIDDIRTFEQSEVVESIVVGKETLDIHATKECGHGRNEERIYIKSNNISCLINKKWRHVQCIIMVIRITDEHEISVKYYVSSVNLPIEELAGIIRKHWQIENNLHWVLDMYFYEDLSRNRKENEMVNLALLRKICLNIIKLDDRYDKPNKNGNVYKLSIKRKMNRYNLYPHEFEELLFSVLPRITLR